MNKCLDDNLIAELIERIKKAIKKIRYINIFRM